MGERNTLDYAGTTRDERPKEHIAQFGIGCGGSIAAGVLAVVSAVLLIATIGGSGIAFDSACIFVTATLFVVSVVGLAFFANLAVQASQTQVDDADGVGDADE